MPNPKGKIIIAGQELTVELIDGTFPDWRKVIPQNYDDTENKIHAIGLYATYLESFIYDTRKNFVKLVFGADETSPIKIVNGLENFIGVLMPMRE